MIEEKIKCLRCGRVLESKKSILRGYGRECYILFQSEKRNFNIDDNNKDIGFLKLEINFLKRQFKELKTNGLIRVRSSNNIDPIERIRIHENYPQKIQEKVQFTVIIKELKIIFTKNEDEIFDYHNILEPISLEIKSIE